MKSVEAGKLKAIRALIDAKATLGAKDEAGETALIKAIKGDQVEAARMLLDAMQNTGGDIHARFQEMVCVPHFWLVCVST